MGGGRTRWGRVLCCLPVLAGLATGLPARALDRTESNAIIESLTEPQAFFALRISPDGKRLAGLGYNGYGTGLFVGEVESLQFRKVVESRRVVRRGYTYQRSPLQVRWIDDELLAVDYNDDESEAMDLSGRKLAGLGARYLGRARRDEAGHVDRVMVQIDPEGETLALVDPRSGERWRDGGRLPGKPVAFAFDAKGVARAATTIDTTFWTETTTVRQWYRPDAQAPWQQLEEAKVTDDHWEPLYAPAEPDTLVVRSRRGRDTWAIFRYDTRRRAEVELMAGHEREDIVWASGLGNEVFQRVVTNGLKPQTHWFDATWATLQTTVDKALPDRISTLEGDARGSVLVFSSSDTDPGRWYVFQTAARTLTEVAQVAPGLDPAEMRPMQTLRYAARDGVSVPAYLTLPAGHGPQPTVVLIHGGPAVRDPWGWNPEVQLLARHGYVVFQPQFRGSTGFGAAFERAGYGQWGLAMQDDVSDGVAYLVAQGIADPTRICIYGASYGGYAALWGLVKTPELYRCGISLSGVSDLDDLLKGRSDFNGVAATRELVRFRMQAASGGAPQFAAVSPLKQVERVRVPVLIAHGEEDRRVPIEQSRRMVDALRSHGKEVQWMNFAREGHGLSLVVNRRKFYNALIDFLDQNTAVPQPAAAASTAK